MVRLCTYNEVQGGQYLFYIHIINYKESIIMSNIIFTSVELGILTQ